MTSPKIGEDGVNNLGENGGIDDSSDLQAFRPAQIELTVAQAAQAAVSLLRENADGISKPVKDLLVAMAKHVASLKWAVKLLEGRMMLRESLAETQTIALKGPLEEILTSIERVRMTDWGIRRGDRAVFSGAMEVEADRVRRALEALDEWYAIQTDPTFVFEREILERLPMAEIFERVVSEFDDPTFKTRMMLFIPDGLLVSTSVERLTVVMAALSDNALRYSDGPVEVSAGINEDQELWIEIADRGPGLQGKDPNKLWRSLSDRDGPDETGRKDGLSLGLYLARIMVESLNGVIEIDDREGGGLAARVFLPQRRRGDF